VELANGSASTALVPALIAKLGDPDPEVQAHSAWLMGYHRVAEARDALRELARDPFAFVRTAAERALEKIHDPGRP
jgi:HEAT repeat protein